MTIHGTTFAFFVSTALLFGALCGGAIERDDYSPTWVPIIGAGGIFIVTLIVLLVRGIGV